MPARWISTNTINAMKLFQNIVVRRTLGCLLLLVAILALVLVPATSAFADGGQVFANQYYVTNTSATVPVRMAPKRGTFVTSATIIGNSLWQTTNTGTVYIGPNSTNACQAIAITSGATVTLSFTQNQWVDLYDWYLDVVTVNDGVCVIYTK